MRKIIFVLISSFLFLIPGEVFAARDITVSADKTTLSGDEEMVITITTSGFTDGESIYVKGAFYKDGSINYFAYTKDSDNWIKNSETTTSQKQVKIGEWDGKITVKSDFSDTGFNENGNYKFKVGFYYTTSGGNQSSVNWSSNVLDINLTKPEPSPSPQQSPSPSPSQSPSPTPKSTPKSSAKSPSPSPKPTDIQTKSVLGEKTATSTPSANLSNTFQDSPSPAAGYTGESSQKIAGIFIGVGSVLIAISSVIYLWYKRLQDKLTINKEKDRFEENKTEN